MSMFHKYQAAVKLKSRGRSPNVSKSQFRKDVKVGRELVKAGRHEFTGHVSRREALTVVGMWV